MEAPIERIRLCWRALYGDKNSDTILEPFINELEESKHRVLDSRGADGLVDDLFWFKDAVVYSLYVDLFNKDFTGLTAKIDYLAELGVNCLWLLPILDSPMRDQGYDVRDYHAIRKELLGSQGNQAFHEFIEKAHNQGIRVVFDVPINHTSEEHSWFKSSLSNGSNNQENNNNDNMNIDNDINGEESNQFYIWNNDLSKYAQARIIFKGLCSSNWQDANHKSSLDSEEYNPPAQRFFHRFFPHQPDLNYRNSLVLIEMCRIFISWIERGIDGFRLDAIPYLWKEDGTNCENLQNTHILVKFMRAVVDYIRPGTLLLAEACQPPDQVVKYFGDAATGEECQAAYHFPVMPRIYRALAEQSSKSVIETLDRNCTPAIPPNAQWFTFLRCHDELTLEMVSPEERDYLFNHYCRDPSWSFREGEGISARLAELMDRDPKKIALAYSILLSLLGTPVLFYGDEFGKLNDQSFYEEMLSITGTADSRYYVRGRVSWEEIEKDLENPDSMASRIFNDLSRKIKTRGKFRCFGRGHLEMISDVPEVLDDGTEVSSHRAMVYKRSFVGEEKVVVINNLSDKECVFKIPFGNIESNSDALGDEVQIEFTDNDCTIIRLYAFQHHWINLE
eukprot:gb/GECH01000085.1/.p1 GENE.gb/GECH01000085.1/~~gb/GECH01000085.1/.p1  ORF type:complete len:619 (+),score=140.18 gb/GECH01000085.1/:1-1857(+)